MAHVLIVYGTTEGHTRRIAERVAAWAQDGGHRACVVDSASIPQGLDAGSFDRFIMAGSLHQGNHQKSLVHFVKANAETLNAHPSAFLSSSLSAVGEDEQSRHEAQVCIDRFLEETGWRPSQVSPVAGALLYTKYDWMKRFIMRQISKSKGGDTDVHQDYEYTNWEKLEAFVREFLESPVPAGQAV